MINMVFACNGRPISYVDVIAVKAMYGTEFIGEYKTSNILERWFGRHGDEFLI